MTTFYCLEYDDIITKTSSKGQRDFWIQYIKDKSKDLNEPLEYITWEEL